MQPLKIINVFLFLLVFSLCVFAVDTSNDWVRPWNNATGGNVSASPFSDAGIVGNITTLFLNASNFNDRIVALNGSLSFSDAGIVGNITTLQDNASNFNSRLISLNNSIVVFNDAGLTGNITTLFLNSSNFNSRIIWLNDTLQNNYYNKSMVDSLISATLTFYFWDTVSDVNSSYKVMNVTQNPTITVHQALNLNNGDVVVYRLNKNTNLSEIGGTLHLHTTVTKFTTLGTKNLQIQGQLNKRNVYTGDIQMIAQTDISGVLTNGASTPITLFANIPQTPLNTSDQLLWQLNAIVTGGGVAPSVNVTVGGTTNNGLDIPTTINSVLIPPPYNDGVLVTNVTNLNVRMISVNASIPIKTVQNNTDVTFKSVYGQDNATFTKMNVTDFLQVTKKLRIGDLYNIHANPFFPNDQEYPNEIVLALNGSEFLYRDNGDDIMINMLGGKTGEPWTIGVNDLNAGSDIGQFEIHHALDMDSISPPFTILPTGYIGMGNSTPKSKLDVKGDITSFGLKVEENATIARLNVSTLRVSNESFFGNLNLGRASINRENTWGASIWGWTLGTTADLQIGTGSVGAMINGRVDSGKMIVQASCGGCQVAGYANTNSTLMTGFDSWGSKALGYVDTSGNISTGKSAVGSLALGYATSGNISTGSSAFGSIAFGQTAVNSFIRTGSDAVGSLAMGWGSTRGNISTGSGAVGSIARGYSLTGDIRSGSNAYGSMASGYAAANAEIQTDTSANGAIASGSSTATGGSIFASGPGSIAMGYTGSTYGSIRTQVNPYGALAQGFASQGNIIVGQTCHGCLARGYADNANITTGISAYGSFAMGYTSRGNIIANGTNTFAFGNNSQVRGLTPLSSSAWFGGRVINANFSEAFGDVEVSTNQYININGSVNATMFTAQSCIMFRDQDNVGFTKCTGNNGVMTCATDADGLC